MIGGVEHTLATSVQCTGIGLHKGRPVELTLRPAAAGTGVLFVRTDLEPHVRFPARGEWVKMLFQDDLLAPDCLERMTATGDATMVVCDRRADVVVDGGRVVTVRVEQVASGGS